MPDRALSIPVTKVVQPIGTFFTGSVDAYALLDICKFDFVAFRTQVGTKNS